MRLEKTQARSSNVTTPATNEFLSQDAWPVGSRGQPCPMGHWKTWPALPAAFQTLSRARAGVGWGINHEPPKTGSHLALRILKLHLVYVFITLIWAWATIFLFHPSPTARLQFLVAAPATYLRGYFQHKGPERLRLGCTASSSVINRARAFARKRRAPQIQRLVANVLAPTAPAPSGTGTRRRAPRRKRPGASRRRGARNTKGRERGLPWGGRARTARQNGATGGIGARAARPGKRRQGRQARAPPGLPLPAGGGGGGAAARSPRRAHAGPAARA